jgi:hypothetical protein
MYRLAADARDGTSWDGQGDYFLGGHLGKSLVPNLACPCGGGYCSTHMRRFAAVFGRGWIVGATRGCTICFLAPVCVR